MRSMLLALLLACQQPNPNDWTGSYESGPGDTYTHLVTVAKVGEHYDVQWYDRDGVLRWVGVLDLDKEGRWIETYPAELSPCGSPPYQWQADNNNQPAAVVRSPNVWTIRRLKPSPR